MKLTKEEDQLVRDLSPPSRGRGLKHFLSTLVFTVHTVAPFTGAWIETISCERKSRIGWVAPFTGAWIET